MGLVVRRSDGRVVCGDGVLADSFVRRFFGLMGRAELGPDESLLLKTSSVHTSFMRFPIDLVFLDRDLRVVKIVERLKPWRVAGCRASRWALELPGGESARQRLEPGERLSVLVSGGESGALAQL